MVAASDSLAGAHTTSGKPSYQQDRHLIHHTPTSSLYLVADGHGSPVSGHLVAHHCAQTLPSLLTSLGILAAPHRPQVPSLIKDAIAQLDRAAIAQTSAQRVYAGSTLCFVLHADSHLVVANVGDSRALLVSAADAKPLTDDHVCSLPQEQARIEAAGGWVVGGLLNGHISMSRALGDDDLKAHRNLTPFQPPDGRPRRRFADTLFTADPDISRTTITPDDLVTVVASDGVWGKLSNETVAAVVRDQLGKGRSAQEAAKAVVRKAIAKGSRDNVTAVVAMLHDQQHVLTRLGATTGLPARTHRRVRTTLGAERKLVDSDVELFASREAPDFDTSTDSGTDYSPRDVRHTSAYGESGKASLRERSLFGRKGSGKERHRLALWSFGSRGANK